MLQRLTGSVLIASFLIFAFSCSTPQKTTSASGSLYPAWYNAASFSSDSLGYSGYGTAVSSDSLEAMEIAEKQARANLESYIAEKTEDIREELESNGSDLAAEPDFILTLRNAHAKVEGAAETREGVSKKTGDYYRGFVQVSVARDQLISLLEEGFSGKSSYWAELNLDEKLR